MSAPWYLNCSTRFVVTLDGADDPYQDDPEGEHDLWPCTLNISGITYTYTVGCNNC